MPFFEEALEFLPENQGEKPLRQFWLTFQQAGEIDFLPLKIITNKG